MAVTTPADLLSVSRATLFYRPRPPQPETVALCHPARAPPQGPQSDPPGADLPSRQ